MIWIGLTSSSAGHRSYQCKNVPMGRYSRREVKVPRLEDLTSGATVRGISAEGLATMLSEEWLGVSYAERATNPVTGCCPRGLAEVCCTSKES